MEGVLEAAREYPYLVLVGSVFLAQLVMVLPIVPLLLSTGALAGRGLLDPVAAILAITSALIMADLVWFELGRRRGARVLGLACRLALEPDACMRQAEHLFSRYGARLLLGARFVPGLITAALPLAGTFRMFRRRFLLYDGGGALLWCSAYVALGFMFADELAMVGGAAAPLGPILVAIGGSGLLAYLAWRYRRRLRFLQQIAIPRITVEELRQKLDAGETVTVVDLRHPIDFEADPWTIPGALYIPAEQLVRRRRAIPRKSEVVVYCHSPEEATSATAALRLRARRFRRVRPLAGGLAAWRERGLPVERHGEELQTEALTLNAT
jgi:membrane protein DedA with SNARE-associated domain/rhodanese-related sulfurtransferase